MHAHKEFDDLYSDIQVYGNLADALRAELANIHSSLQINGFHETIDKGSPWWVSVKLKCRRGELTMASKTRLFSCNLSERGIGLGHAATTSLPALAQMLDAWFIKHTSIFDLQRGFEFVRIDEKAVLYEKGPAAYVAASWQQLKDYIALEQRLGNQYIPRLASLVEEAFLDPALRKLYPYSSHDTLHFSRCIGGAYLCDYPSAQPTPDHTALGEVIYQVFDATGIQLGKGSASEAVEIMLSALTNDEPAMFYDPEEEM
jgi:Family of unknown function (DUF6193)